MHARIYVNYRFARDDMGHGYIHGRTPCLPQENILLDGLSPRNDLGYRLSNFGQPHVTIHGSYITGLHGTIRSFQGLL